MKVPNYSLLGSSSIPTWYISLPWLSINLTTKLPQNFHSDSDAGLTLNLPLIWTYPPPIKKSTTQIEIET